MKKLPVAQQTITNTNKEKTNKFVLRIFFNIEIEVLFNFQDKSVSNVTNESITENDRKNFRCFQVSLTQDSW